MTSVEIIINPDGSVLLPRGNKQEDELLKKIMIDTVDSQVLNSFFSISENSEIIFGDHRLCG